MATLANGTQLHKLDDTGQAITHTYSDVRTIGEFGGERNVVEYTVLDNDVALALPGIANYGELNLEVCATPEAYVALEQDFESKAINNYAITFPFSTEEGNMDKKFKGFVRTCRITGIEPDNLLTISVVIRIVSKPEEFVKPSVD